MSDCAPGQPENHELTDATRKWGGERANSERQDHDAKSHVEWPELRNISDSNGARTKLHDSRVLPSVSHADSVRCGYV